ncbi:thiol:disulfide interchange protein DsbA/DsbL [Massilia sp. CF038]|jgi:thiol:disulfide interchange protein DsbA|uniref:thiol:disulfide interchange protein DsbA/DsbL n=1 Tax=Massilia sp. CF038 TaxID=1881045 RepID=UPI000922E79C|nr:thiol:disulfide interchange protein DsbA/DsbL [Massilia sp. CF038]SHH15350.1 Thiol:disulfide interchange protein DsbA [Massilia sp. CF038]
MRFLRLAVAAAALIATNAFASPAEPKNGAEYTTLTAPQATQAVGNKVEVLEFFAYHCPHCYVIESDTAAWIKKQGSNIHFRRIAYPFQGPSDPETHLFLTLEAMGKADEVSPKVFRAMHVERQRLIKDDAILEWVKKSSGLDNAKFLEAWNSFGVLTKLKQMPKIVNLYGINGTPTFVVDGKYVTSPSIVGAANPAIGEQAVAVTMSTLDFLVAKAAKEKAPAAPVAAPAPAAPAAKTAKTVKK